METSRLWENIERLDAREGNLSAASDSRDGRIIEIIEELSRQLAFAKSPGRLAWADSVSMGRSWRTVPSDECFVRGKKLYLAKRMHDKLEPEEWRPILASSLILKWRLEGSVKRTILIRIVLPLFLLFAFSTSLLVVFGLSSSDQITAGQRWIFGFNFATLLALVIIPGFSYGSYYQEAKLVADRQAADLVGRQAFLDALRKIDMMGWRDVEKAKAKHRWTPRVGIERRIKNLRDNYK